MGRPRFRAYGHRHIDRMQHLDSLSSDQLVALKVASAVLPFRVNDYVLDELIDWDNIPFDPMYQLSSHRPACWLKLISFISRNSC